MRRKYVVYDSLTLFIRKYEWIYLFIGMMGNVFFLIGTVLYLMDSSVTGWFFLIGTIGMLINSIGSFLYKTEYKGKTAITAVGREIREQYHDHVSGKEDDR
jgi:hypothetical protein